jgi:hypothetical protein
MQNQPGSHAWLKDPCISAIFLLLSFRDRLHLRLTEKNVESTRRIEPIFKRYAYVCTDRHKHLLIHCKSDKLPVMLTLKCGAFKTVRD